MKSLLSPLLSSWISMITRFDTQMAAGLGRLGAGVVSLLAGQDVNMSIQTATNAVENNFIPAVTGIGLIAYEAYDIYCTGRDEGLEAAALKLGFTIATAAAGVHIGKRVYQLGTIIAPTASAAMQAYKLAHPVFAKLYDQAAKVIAKGVDKVRQFDARLDNIVHTATGRITERLGTGQATRQVSEQAITQNPLVWTSWNNYSKVVDSGKEYAKIGDRLYTRHAVDRMQPSGLGTSAGPTQGAGHSFPV